MGAVLAWWLAVQVVGLLALPLTFHVFKGLPERGYAFARPLGLMLAGYVFWLLGSLGFLRNSLGGVLFALVVLAAVSVYVGRRELGLAPLESGQETLWAFLRRQKKLVLLVEGLFLAGLAGWALYRAYSPDIATAGGEKFMEYAFINAILRSPRLPPADPWLSGFAISYYYFGYLILSMLIRLSGLPSNIAFNLGLALLFALTITGAFSLAYNLVALAQRRAGREMFGQAAGYGLLGSLLLAIMGNLEGFLELLHAWRVGGAGFWKWLDIRDLATLPPGGAAVPNRYLWWWRASRVLQDYDPLGNPIEIIDEFPFFSFMLGDIHPHVLALPFGLMLLALTLNLLASERVYESLRRWGPLTLLYALCLGGMAFLNTWDFPVYGALMVLAFALRSYVHHRALNREWLQEVLGTGIMLAAAGVILYIPFYLGFQSQAGGPAFSLWAKTRIAHYLVMFGPFVFIAIAFVLAAGAGLPEAWRTGRLSRSALYIIGAVALLLAVLSIITGRWLALCLTLLMAAGALVLWRRLEEAGEETDWPTMYALLILLVGLGLTFVVEYVYLRDTFGTRMNTIFKFYFQAWSMLAIAGAYGVYYVLNRTRRLAFQNAFLVGLIALVAAGMVYPVLAAPNRAEGFQRKPTLDGIAYAAQYWPADYAAVQWLNAHVREPAVILEAHGGSYTPYGRISAMTGIPTLLGWGGHELQWRGSYDEPGRREPDIEAIYRSMDREQIVSLLDKYNITYVYVGPLEREKFQLSQPMIDKFSLFMDLVYDQDGVRIYQRRGK
jgi:YYY domain-containing protein